jgi:hypothetical protein
MCEIRKCTSSFFSVFASLSAILGGFFVAHEQWKIIEVMDGDILKYIGVRSALLVWERK